MSAANGVLVADTPIDLADLGIDTISPTEAADYFANSSPSVIGLLCHNQNLSEMMTLVDSQRKRLNRSQFFLVSKDLSNQELCQAVGQMRPIYVVESLDKQDLIQAFQKTFSEYYQQEQTEKLAELIAAKNDELKRLTVQLETKVEERQKQLENSVKQNTEAENKLKILKKALVHIYQAQSIREIEVGITQALSKEFDLAAAKITQPGLSNATALNEGSYSYKVTLKFGSRDFGQLIFLRKDRAFDKVDKKFLSQVADAVSLSIDKSFQLQKGQELKRQWEATFDAISDPLCLTDSQYNIIRVNKAFRQKVKLANSKITGNKCYQVLFDRSMVCEGCHRGKTFQMRSAKKSQEVFRVHSHVLPDTQGMAYFQMYRDISQSLNLERQVIESAKMAELGTISSSIAHELNNPIGGMLNFLQLMKMDLTGDEPYYQDIVEIENGTQKCRSIVQNLLGFSRKSDENEVREIDLIEVLEQAIKITELKTRSIGILITRDYSQQSIPMKGKFNSLAQAFRNLLQNSQESIISKRQQVADYKGTITVHARTLDSEVVVEVIDDGLGIDRKEIDKIFDPLYTTKGSETNSGLGLTLAQQIVEDHQGTIDVTIKKDKKISFEVRLNKSEVES